MALQDTTIPVNAAANSLLKPHSRINSRYEGTVTFGTDSGASTLSVLNPCGKNDVTDQWGAWVAPDPTIMTVTLTSATAGNFTLTVNGVTTGNIAYNASTADVVAALAAIGVKATCSLATAVYTVTFTDLKLQAVLPTVSGDVSGITGGTPTAVATAGTATNGLHDIRGFVYPEEVTLSATEDTLVVISMSAEIYYDAILATVDSGDEDALKVALKDGLIAKGFQIQGLPNIG